jgi:hypothetical protein
LLSKVTIFLTKNHDYLHINAVVARMSTRDIVAHGARRRFSKEYRICMQSPALPGKWGPR